jgi:uncharacterized membrane protein YbhN (UPF0104 family)
VAAPVAPTAAPLVRWGLAVVAAGAVAVLAWSHRGTVYAGADALVRADAEWLALAVGATVALWLATAVAQLGSMPIRPPVGRLLAVQLAASFVNHFVPAGSGSIGVNVRFLRRHGVGWMAAAAATGLNTLAAVVTHLVLLSAAILAAPTLAYRVQPAGSWGRPPGHLWHWLAVGVVALLLLAMPLAHPGWRRRVVLRLAGARSRSVGELRGLRPVLRDPYRAAALWLGSLCMPLLHSVVLFAVLRSVGVGVDMGSAVVVYLVVSSLSALLPSPGGVGALDVTLLAGLVALGITSALALGAVLGYRLVTVWLPLIPGAVALTLLVRRRIL